MALADELVAVRRYKTKARHALTQINEVGRLFVATHQTPSTDITGQTSFDATTPTFAIYGSNVTHRGVLKRLRLCQSGTVAGGTIFVSVAIDTANRNSAGGTAFTPQNRNASSSNSSVWTFKSGITATAAGTGTRYVEAATAAASLGNILEIDFTEGYHEDGLIWSAAGTTTGAYTGSLLVYTWAATTGPSWKFQLEWMED